jgi:hypothetical protein
MWSQLIAFIVECYARLQAVELGGGWTLGITLSLSICFGVIARIISRMTGGNVDSNTDAVHLASLRRRSRR